jgi:hypothetical protein
VKWKGKPIEELLEGGVKGGLSYSFRCLVCDLAFQMGLSEMEFYRLEPISAHHVRY